LALSVLAQISPTTFPGGVPVSVAMPTMKPAKDAPSTRVEPAPSTARRRAGVAPITWATIAAVLLRLTVLTSAQDVTEAALKAAFIYNFAMFTEWPDSVVPAAGPVVICVLGDPAVGEALQRASKGRVLAGHSIVVSLAVPAGTQRGCHVLYVSGVTIGQASQVIAGLRDVPVLTLSDIDGFTDLGGIAQFFFDRGRLRFTIEIASANRARLQISSKLLVLSKTK
jgi:hypothetical protein